MNIIKYLGTSNAHLTLSLVEFTSLHLTQRAAHLWLLTGWPSRWLPRQINTLTLSTSLRLLLNPCFKIKVPSHFTRYTSNMHAFQADSQFVWPWWLYWKSVVYRRESVNNKQTIGNYIIDFSIYTLDTHTHTHTIKLNMTFFSYQSTFPHYQSTGSSWSQSAHMLPGFQGSSARFEQQTPPLEREKTNAI